MIKAKSKQTYCNNCKKTSIACQCSIFCKYCHGIHKLINMPKGLCPETEALTKFYRKNKAFTCSKCKGMGHFLKKSETVFEQLEEKYGQRLKIWKRDPTSQNPPQKQRYVQKTQIQKKACSACSSTGMIERFRFCCVKGCKVCRFSGVVPSRRWQQQKQRKANETIRIVSAIRNGIYDICDLDAEIDECSNKVPSLQKQKGSQKDGKEQAAFFKTMENASEDSDYSENLLLYEEVSEDQMDTSVSKFIN